MKFAFYNSAIHFSQARCIKMEQSTNFNSRDRRSIPIPSLTPIEIGSAIGELNALMLNAVGNKVTEDNQLLLFARMSEPILRMTLDLYDIMINNKECCIIFNGWMTDEERIDTEKSEHEETLLHRNDISKLMVKHYLAVDFENVEGYAKEIVSYSHRFDEYTSLIQKLRDGYVELVKYIQPETIAFGTNVGERRYAALYVDCCRSMDGVASNLVDIFLLRFTDPADSIKSILGRRIWHHHKNHPLLKDIKGLRGYVGWEGSIAADPTSERCKIKRRDNESYYKISTSRKYDHI